MELPVELEALSRQRRVTDIVEDGRLVGEGKLEPHDSGFIIRLRPTQHSHSYRRRFSIAHELAHTFFYAFVDGRPTRITPWKIATSEEEWVCNRFAAEILMPRAVLFTVLDVHRVKKDSAYTVLMSLAGLRRRFGVSDETIAIRLIRELGIARCLFVAYRSTGRDSWRRAWSCVPLWLEGRLSLPRFATSDCGVDFRSISREKKLARLNLELHQIELGNLREVLESNTVTERASAVVRVSSLRSQSEQAHEPRVEIIIGIDIAASPAPGQRDLAG